MSLRGEPIRFLVPIDGVSLSVRAHRALMADGHEGLHSFRVDSDRFIAGGIHEACALVNRLLDAGMAWSDLATFRNGEGVMSALIEAADNRLRDLQGSARGGDHAA